MSITSKGQVIELISSGKGCTACAVHTSCYQVGGSIEMGRILGESCLSVRSGIWVFINDEVEQDES